MPFGLVNAPATFQRLMEVVLSGLTRGSCHVYLDDVLVLGATLQEHNANLRKVFDRIRSAGLRLKPKKCDFAQESVEYLGHVVSADGIQTDPEKLRAVHQYPVPTDVRTLRSFLGLASYYRRFVPGFSKIAAPLNALTRKDIPFVWTPDCHQAFEKLKELLTSVPLLRYPDFERPFILETDASGDGLGAVLAQQQEDGTVAPIAYASRSLQKHEKNYGITELEGLGVVWAAKHFRPYLYGHHCTVFTDHEALKSLLNTPQLSGKLARWGMALQELNLNIQHRFGKHNTNADALSRHPLPESADGHTTEEVVAALRHTEPGGSDDSTDETTLATLQRRDEELAPMINYLETGVLPSSDKEAKQTVLSSGQYTLEDDVLYRVEDDGTLRVIPPICHRERLFLEAHGGKFGAHLSDAKVYSEIRRHYWWSGMRRDISRWTRGCIVCATRSVGRAVKPPLTPIPVTGPFDRVGVDVIQFPKTSRGNQYAVVFVDYLTKWPEVFAVPDQSAATIARLLVEEIVSRHGVPSEVLSDRGRAFLSGLMQEVERLLGFKKVNTTAYHPQTDGLVERYNRTLTSMLAKTVYKRGPEWDVRLPYVLFAYRACQQSSTMESPFFLLYGRDPQLPTPAVLSPRESRAVKDLKEYGVELYSRMSEAWELAQHHITRAQKHQKKVYDRGAKNPFRAGERVFLLKPAEQTGARRKFARPFHGPYRLLEVGTNTARICPVDKPESEPILVSLGRLRHCPDEIGNEFWPPSKVRKATRQTQGGRVDLTRPPPMEAAVQTSLGAPTAEESSRELDPNSAAEEDGDSPPDSRHLKRGGMTEEEQSGLEELQDCQLDDQADVEEADDDDFGPHRTPDGAGECDLPLLSSTPPATEDVEVINTSLEPQREKLSGTTTEDVEASGEAAAGTITAPGETAPQVNQHPGVTTMEQMSSNPLSPAYDMDPSTPLGDEKHKRKRRRRWVEDQPRKWAGRLRSGRSPRTDNPQQGEM